MTIRYIAIGMLGCLMAATVGCNSDVETPELTVSSTAVRSFSLADNDSVVANLDSVFFSIDLVKGLIFNADSLPKNTDVTGLTPVILTNEGVAVCELTVRRKGTPKDTVYDYLTNSTAKIDFTNPVSLRIVSEDGVNERRYTVRVNVHKESSDTLAWSREARTPLPSLFTQPTEQRTTRRAETLWCLTRLGRRYSLAQGVINSDLLSVNTVGNLTQWTIEEVALPFEPQVNSFTASADAFGMLDKSGRLWTSADSRNWSLTPLTWHSMTGAYGGTLVGTYKDTDGLWYSQQWPSGAKTRLQQGMPVEGMSVPVEYTFAMSADPQMLAVGGRRDDGTLSADTWGYDGNTWARVSQRSLPQGLEGVAVAPYYTLEVNRAWIVTEMPSMLAFGGRKSDGTVNRTVYMSDDYGRHWKEAPLSLQIPEHLIMGYDAQAYVVTANLQAEIAQPKISKPLEQWECPFIYLFGGVNASGALHNTLWRGVINRYLFKPVV